MLLIRQQNGMAQFASHVDLALPACRNELAFHSEIVVRHTIHSITFYQYFVPAGT
jgi:hypothetical protein